VAEHPIPSVTVEGEVHLLSTDEPLSFGRDSSNSVVLPIDDVGLSRRAGEVLHRDGQWWVVNASSSRPFEVVDDLGFSSVVAPGRRLALDGEATVVVTGTVRRHALVIRVPTDDTGSADHGPSAADGTGEVETSVGTGVVVNDADREALAALFEGYLRPFPRHDPHPRTYADAAARLDWPRTTLVKRIEYLRNRLTAAGVPSLHGDNALRSLAEYVISTAILTRDDLDRLP